MIKRFDKNDNGYLDAEEMRELKKVLQKRREEIQGKIEKRSQPEEKQSGSSFKKGGGMLNFVLDLLIYVCVKDSD